MPKKLPPNPSRPRETPRQLQQRREDRAVETLLAQALRLAPHVLDDDEITRYLNEPVKLTAADEAALERSRPGLMKSIRRILRRPRK